MNDRAVSVLENYEIEVLRTWKGRGAILCESDQGLLILKEYTGPKDKIIFQDALLRHIRGQGFLAVENLLKTKEGEFLVYDQDRTPYILKTYFDGKECNLRDMRECMQAVRTLAKLHRASCVDPQTFPMPGHKVEFRMDKEYEKHNRELKRVRKFLKEKSQKTNFEIFLLKHYDHFLHTALRTAEEAERYFAAAGAGTEQKAGNLCTVCHGDYQYHNIMVRNRESNGGGNGDAAAGEMAVINFEKCVPDHPVRDLYLFMRKLLEKSGWSQELGEMLLTAYGEERPLSEEDYGQLYYRLRYPEKFWKIVNFYYNSGKAWIPDRNMEKLEKLLAQEPEKNKFLENFKNTHGSFSFSAH